MNYLLIDGNALGNAAQDAPKLTIGDEQIQAVFGFIKMIHRGLRVYPNHLPLMLWDGKAKWRYDLYPQYKGNRDNLKPEVQAERDTYKAQRPKIMQAMSLLGIKQVTDKEAEADDLAGYFTRALKGEIVLYTGDGDWIQLISDMVSWHRPIKPEKKCDLLSFEDVTGFKNIRQFIDAKCLVGDTSDHIPGVGGIGKETVGEFLNKYGSVAGFFKAMKEEGALDQKMPIAHRRLATNQAPEKESSKFGKLAPAKAAYIRNYKLMNLRNEYVPNKSSLVIDRGNFDKEEFRLFCKEHLFRSILSNFDNWIEPFEKFSKG